LLAGSAAAAGVAGAAAGAATGAATSAGAAVPSGAFASSPLLQPDNKAIATKLVAIIILVFIVDPIYFKN
jgi:hypothetical protein